MNVQLVDELREVADWFRLRGLDENAALLDHAAHVVQCAADFFAWYNKYYPEPSSHPHHPWCVLGTLLTHDKNDSAHDLPEKAAQLVEALKKVAQSLEWYAHGRCRGFDDGAPLPTNEAVELAERTLAKVRA